ncbi:methylated-DNA--[protein]-cysteine S-methyltransferase [Thermodesulfobacteriota bacterium]
MKKIIKNYLQKLSKAGVGLNFVSIVYHYGKFAIYCLIGPEENIIHLSFTSGGHVQAQKQLSVLDERVDFKTLKRTDFAYNKIFNDYFSGNLSRFPIKIDSPFIDAGSPFQQRVWSQISAIPYGSCITYQGLAELAGSPRAARAAGTACGANPLPIIIPCHRVVAQNGLGGFGGGLDIKKSLLSLENAWSNCI